MDESSVSQRHSLPEGGAVGVELTDSEHVQVARIAAELAGLLDLPEDVRIKRAAYDLVRLFVVDGGMPVSRALDTLGMSLGMTLVKMADRTRHH